MVFVTWKKSVNLPLPLDMPQDLLLFWMLIILCLLPSILGRNFQIHSKSWGLFLGLFFLSSFSLERKENIKEGLFWLSQEKKSNEWSWKQNWCFKVKGDFLPGILSWYKKSWFGAKPWMYFWDQVLFVKAFLFVRLQQYIF